MPGKHNILNSLAAIAVARELGVPIKSIKKSLSNFPGISRRFEIIGDLKMNGRSFMWIDDYGHHPSEMKEVLETISNVWGDRRVIMIFQPHRYTRTAEHFKEFIEILQKIDNIILMDIYGANETPIENINSKTIMEEIKRNNNNILLINDQKELFDHINNHIKDNDILLTMGAGNISKFVNYLRNSLNC